MADEKIYTNIGHVTAYAYAKSKGYTGTEEQFATDQANFAANAQQVREDKESVEATVATFDNTTVPAAVQTVTAEGTRQVGIVGTAGDTQVARVQAEGTTQVGVVQTEGTTQKNAVQAKGDEVIASIPSDYTELTEEVEDLKSSIEYDEGIIYDIDDSSSYWQQGDWDRETGVKNTSRVSYIGTAPAASLNDVAKIVAVDSDYTLILLAFSGAEYIGWWYNNAFTKDDTIDDRTNGMSVVDINQFSELYPSYTFRVNCLRISGGNVYPSSVENKVLTYININKRESIAFNNFASQIDEYAPVWQNLFNPDDEDIAYNKYVNTDNGNLVNATGVNTTGFVPIKPNQYYSTRVLASYMGANNAKYIIFYDANKTRLGQKAGTYLEDSGSWRALKVIFTNTDAAYIRVSYSANNDTFMIVEGETYPSDFKPYGKAFKDIVVLNNTQISEVEQIVDQKTGGSHTLYGKKIAYNGDSICESRLAEGNTYNGGAYAKIIADTVGGSYENRGVGGGILASAPGDGGSTPSRCVVSDVTNMASDADLICFEGGINDYWRKVPLGTITAESDLTGSLDTATIIGALESIFRQAKAKWVGKPICFVIVHKIQTTYYTDSSAGYSFKDVHDAIIQVCNKYAIPYYDACLGSGLNGHDSTQSNTYLTSNSEGTGDGTHPNEAGYRRYYVPQLIALFESVMPRLADT